MGGGFKIGYHIISARESVFFEIMAIWNWNEVIGIKTAWAYKYVPILDWCFCPHIGYRKHDPLSSDNEESPCGDYFHKDLAAWKDKGIIVYKPNWR